ncbi:threonine synthase [Parenemella sanctibonifatiensis]|uniref:Threonine synthase n=1 Tax=Parenemella sanctibonifatiensis TaxID=2016505 RepID=A0A255E5T2_9ACTN|nr:threonine synthase [Parenemella sanctibonifatiensis]
MSAQYVSTRGLAPARSFSEILLEGLAPDGGLYLPQEYPQLTAADLDRLGVILHEQGYAALASQVLALFIDDVPELDALVRATYTTDNFADRAIVPVTWLSPELGLAELSHGPTLAFKDMAMQLLGAFFEDALSRRGETLTILGATSGDTGSAAEYAMRGRAGIEVFMLSPHGRMTQFQQAQMFSLMEENIHNIAVEGVFDDCQDLVKAVSADLDFKRRHRIGTVNSINWARMVAQVVYYVATWLQARDAGADRISVAVPTGNFGNICAAHVARRMGVPFERLLLATNENNVLAEFFETGHYRIRSGAETRQTSSPSMDISKASNLERYVADLLDRDTERVADLFGRQLRENGEFDLSTDSAWARVREDGFVAGSSSHADRLAAIQWAWSEHDRMIDPHTADAITVARRLQLPGETIVAMETAQPVKFGETIREALDRDPVRPVAYEGIEELPRRVQVIDNDLAKLTALIENR